MIRGKVDDRDNVLGQRQLDPKAHASTLLRALAKKAVVVRWGKHKRAIEVYDLFREAGIDLEISFKGKDENLFYSDKYCLIYSSNYFRAEIYEDSARLTLNPSAIQHKPSPSADDYKALDLISSLFSRKVRLLGIVVSVVFIVPGAYFVSYLAKALGFAARSGVPWLLGGVAGVILAIIINTLIISRFFFTDPYYFGRRQIKKLMKHIEDSR